MMKKKQLYTLKMLKEDWDDCTACEIGNHCRQKVYLDTFPTMLSKVDILMIGEGPGVTEDIKGYPFVGAAGKLLRDAILQTAVAGCPDCSKNHIEQDLGSETCKRCDGVGFVKIGFTNLIACRPYLNTPSGPGNRPPEAMEVLNCMERLVSTIKILNPQMLVAVGNEAWSWLGTILDYVTKDGSQYNIARITHPSYYVRNGGTETQNYKLYVAAIQKILRGYWNENKTSS
jgi:DNA polymerase